MSPERNPRTLFHGIADFLKLPGVGEEFEFRVIGVCHPETASLAREFGIESHLHISPGLPFLKALEALAENDVLAVVEAPCGEGIFLPSKVVDYAQVGRPILSVSPATGTMRDLLKETRAGVAAHCKDPKSVLEALTQLHGSWRAGSLESDFPSANLWEKFKPDTVVRQYCSVLNSVGA